MSDINPADCAFCVAPTTRRLPNGAAARCPLHGGEPPRPDLVPVYDAVDRAMRDELVKWTFPIPQELRLALGRAAVGTLRDASMLNYDRPWEDQR